MQSTKFGGYAIKIKEYKAFDEPMNPYIINYNFVPPQSYAYIDEKKDYLEYFK